MNDENSSPKSNNCIKTTPNKKIRNPFDKVLIEQLHKPLCSPGMCKVYKRQNNGSFRWDIDQACTLVPKEIVACNSQFEPSPDPVLEKIAEDATEKFFSQEMVMPSPLESSKKVNLLFNSSQGTDAIVKMTNRIREHTIILRDVSAQTVLTLPPQLPPEIEKILEPFCTFTQDQHLDNDYDNANVSLRRKLFFEEHSDGEHHYDSEQTDDEVHIDQPPPSRFDTHTPVLYSPDLSKDMVATGMKRTFGTPLHKSKKPHNKILDILDIGEPGFSPIRKDSTPSSLASVSISPVTKATSSDEEKNNFTSPECDMTPCACAKGGEVCNCTPPRGLTRSASLQDSPLRARKPSPKRSLSMSSLNRSRSVQKLDFSMNMSVDGSIHDQSADSESSPLYNTQGVWSIVEEASIQNLIKNSSLKAQTQYAKTHVDLLDETPVKSKNKSNVFSHEISKMRHFSGHNMSLDNSTDNDNLLDLEDKKVDLNNIDLKYITEMTQFGRNNKYDTSSFKRIDSGYNETTFYANTSSYYESAIKPSELTVTHSKTALKEISNVQWARLDSGYNEASGDSMQFYDSLKGTGYNMGVKLDNKENMAKEDQDRFMNRNEAMSTSEIFTDDMTFNCNFSSTPSKNRSRRGNC